MQILSSREIGFCLAKSQLEETTPSEKGKADKIWLKIHSR